MNYFIGMKIEWITFRGHRKPRLILGVITMNLGSFLKVKQKNKNILGVKYFWSNPDIVWGKQ